ncbi:MAG TPA: SRPBCC family protein [Smithellaceae bacterium]|nr:SRPBCC family protein [Smithellaceae bacterium]HOS10250.1 SRPBCC family protein [Smithellaceae bacterium]HOU05703.1 SRPBCC family protein [Smithellaceae bacterium]HPL50993.1 SRPBCC family protein [Smithellaceae bacterium]HQG24332.1 SRPBCC family protein [Smithellaceae bacterium]
MSLFENRILTDSIEIRATPETVFKFLTSIVDDESYKTWHNADHVSFRWLKGQPWSEGSVMVAQEYLHGKIHKFKFQVTRIVPYRHIEYSPTSRFMRKFFPKNEFVLEPKGKHCLFIARGTYRVGWIGKTFFKKAIENGLSSVRRHMKEEGENLKVIIEHNRPPTPDHVTSARSW